jgi:hypothetical protein
VRYKLRPLPEMQNPFATAVQWPDDFRRFIVHLQRPYFTAAVVETASAGWLLISWAPGTKVTNKEELFRAVAEYCRQNLDLTHLPIEFVERKHGHELPKFLMAQTAAKELFIVEPDHATPLVEVRETAVAEAAKPKTTQQRFDVITQWRLAEMRKYYRQYLERQKPLQPSDIPSATLAK